MAKELKSLCGHSYRPRKYDLEEGKPRRPYNTSARQVNKENYNQANQFQPLANIQTVPPYSNMLYNSRVTGQYHNQQYSQPISQAYFNCNNNNNENPNNNDTQNAPLIYNQAVPNVHVNKNL